MVHLDTIVPTSVIVTAMITAVQQTANVYSEDVKADGRAITVVLVFEINYITSSVYFSILINIYLGNFKITNTLRSYGDFQAFLIQKSHCVLF
jgi:hypothetical protein